MRINSDRAEVGMKVCAAPAYRSKPVTDKDIFRDLGITLGSIGIKANSADTIVVKCETDGWTPPQSLLVKLPEGGMLMLWEGVFLVLKKEQSNELPDLLKRRRPDAGSGSPTRN